MNPSLWLYNLGIHVGLPVLTAGNYLSFRGRDPDLHTALKFEVPSRDFLTDNIELWLHGASVGEAELINQLLKWKDDAGLKKKQILVTTQTLSGLNQVDHERKLLLPADYPGLIGPLVEQVDAGTLIVLETELWPNLFRLHPNKLYLFNGRISDSSIDWYRCFKPLIASTLTWCDRILARTEVDYGRFKEFVALDDVGLEEVGNLKWVSTLESPELTLEIPFADNKPILVVGSTHEGEEEMILEELHGMDANFIVGPRHLNRIDRVKELLDRLGLVWITSSEFTSAGENPDVDVFLLDEFGLLESSYRLADLAIVGGSWDSTGGHNLLEAAQYGVPVVTGQNLDNFRASADLLSENDLLDVTRDPKELRSVVERLLGETGRDRRERVESLRRTITPIKERYRETFSNSIDS